MRSFLAMISTVFLCGTLCAGDAPSIFQWVVADGVVYTDATTQISFATTIHKSEPIPLQTIQVIKAESVAPILIPLSTARVIADEIEPYIMLMKRGKDVDETIEHGGGVSLAIRSTKASLGVRLIRKNPPESVIDLTGDSALVFLDALIGFPAIAETWAAEMFGKVPAAAAMVPASGEQSNNGAINLKTISSDYFANEIAATQKYDQYKGKSITASGTIRSVSMDRETGLPRILFNETIKFFSMSCAVSDPESIKKASSLQPGQQIAVEGIWRGPNDALQATIYDARIIE